MVAKKEWKKGGFKKVLVFDENSRREYLLGFRKRKNERRKQAQQEQMEKEKAKKRELKQEVLCLICDCHGDKWLSCASQ